MKLTFLKLFILSLAVFSWPAASNADSTDMPTINNPTDSLQVSIPGMKRLSEPTQCGDKMCNNWIWEYIASMYNYGVAVAGIIATVVMMFGGVLWLTSAGNATRVSEAKAWISASVTGLVLMLASYTVLQQINPAIVNETTLEVKIVEKAPDIENGSESEMGITTSGGALGSLQSISGIGVKVAGTVSDPRLPPETIEYLKKAVAAAERRNLKLLVTSAHRTIEKQTELWEEALAKYGTEEKARKYVAKPSVNSPHVKGVAVDICIDGTPECGKMNAKSANLNTANVSKLKEIMFEAGFSRYCGEWWHYQPDFAPPGRPCKS